MLPPPPTPTRALLLLLVAASAVLAADDKPVPDYLHLCKRNDPNLSECIKESVESLRPRLATGMPEMNVPPMEPLYLHQLVLNQNPNMNIVANNIKAYQTTSFQIKDLKVDPEKGDFKFKLYFPKMKIDGDYDMNGRILTLPMKGSGPVQLNITEVAADVEMHTEPETRDGEEYMALKNMKVKIGVGNGSIRVGNLFGGDKVLGEMVNSAVNANFGQTLNELKPSVEHALEDALLETGRQIMYSYPRDKLLLKE